MRGLFLTWHQSWLCSILSNWGCKGNWHSGVNNLDIESISVKKAKSQITVTEDVFPENKRFVSESNEGQSIPYCAAYHIENSLLVYLGLFSTLRLVFRRYKLYSECLTTTIQKQNYNRASEIHFSEWTKLYVVFRCKRRHKKYKPPFLLLMTIASSWLHQVRFWVGKFLKNCTFGKMEQCFYLNSILVAHKKSIKI